MGKRAVDLSAEELAAMGARAARSAAQEAQRAGLPVTGIVTTYEGREATTVLAQLLPSGTVTFVQKADEAAVDDGRPAKPGVNKAAD